MSKHTPGPWVYAIEYGPNVAELPCITTVGRCANYVIGLPSEYPGGNYRDGDPCGDEEADARLMASAPDLLDALQVVVADWAAQFERNGHLAPAWCKQARAAIAKASEAA